MMFTKRPSRWLVIVLALCCSMLIVLSPLGASVGTPPYVDQRTICGTWEAIDQVEPRLFVASIDAARTGSIAMVLGSRARPDSDIFGISQVRVDKAGIVTMEAAADDGLRLVVRGRGRRFGTSGDLDADVELWGETDEYGPTIFHVQFHMRDGGYFATLRALMQKADGAISAATRKKK